MTPINPPTITDTIRFPVAVGAGGLYKTLGSGTHFTYDISITIQIHWKFILIPTTFSQNNHHIIIYMAWQLCYRSMLATKDCMTAKWSFCHWIVNERSLLYGIPRPLSLSRHAIRYHNVSKPRKCVCLNDRIVLKFHNCRDATSQISERSNGLNSVSNGFDVARDLIVGSPRF